MYKNLFSKAEDQFIKTSVYFVMDKLEIYSIDVLYVLN